MRRSSCSTASVTRAERSRNGRRAASRRVARKNRIAPATTPAAPMITSQVARSGVRRGRSISTSTMKRLSRPSRIAPAVSQPGRGIASCTC